MILIYALILLTSFVCVYLLGMLIYLTIHQKRKASEVIRTVEKHDAQTQIRDLRMQQELDATKKLAYDIHELIQQLDQTRPNADLDNKDLLSGRVR